MQHSPGDVAQIVLDCLDPVALLDGCCFSQTYNSNFGVCEDDLGNSLMIRRRDMTTPWMSIELCTFRICYDGIRRCTSLIFPLVLENGAVVDVPGGIQPWIWFVGLMFDKEGVINVKPFAG